MVSVAVEIARQQGRNTEKRLLEVVAGAGSDGISTAQAARCLGLSDRVVREHAGRLIDAGRLRRSGARGPLFAVNPADVRNKPGPASRPFVPPGELAERLPAALEQAS